MPLAARSSLIAVSSVLAILVSATDAAPSNAARLSTRDRLRILTVSGEGEVKSVPDEAGLSAGVVSEAPTAQAALDINKRAMDGVFASLKQQGIPDRSIQTSEFSVSPQYDNQSNNSAPHIVGYQVSNRVTVVIDDLSKLGASIDALVGSGANSLGGITFTVRDSKSLMRQAREAAVRDAMDRAQNYARAAGVALGPIVQIADGGAIAPRTIARPMALMATAPTPVAAGEQTLSANVSMTFEIR